MSKNPVKPSPPKILYIKDEQPVPVERPEPVANDSVKRPVSSMPVKPERPSVVYVKEYSLI